MEDEVAVADEFVEEVFCHVEFFGHGEAEEGGDFFDPEVFWLGEDVMVEGDDDGVGWAGFCDSLFYLADGVLVDFAVGHEAIAVMRGG